MSDIDALAKEASAASGDSSKIDAIIQKAIDSEGVWAFGELLDVVGETDSAWCRELGIFCFGRYKDHLEHRHVELDDKQSKKLRQLTVASLAAESGEVSYDLLKSELQLEDLRALEDLLLDTMYQGLIDGKLDQSRALLVVDFAQGRDVRPEDIARVTRVLDNWLQRSNTLTRSIDERINTARSEITVEKMRSQEFETRVKEIKENLRAILEAQEGGGHGDEPAHRRGLGGRHRNGGGGGGGGGGIGGFMDRATSGIRKGFFQ